MSHNISFWDRTFFEDTYDVLVIGAGIVGCSAAIHLSNANPALKIGLIERGGLPDGASTRNAGFACFGSLTEVCDDLGTMGIEETLSLVTRRFEGLGTLLKLVTPEAIDYKPTGGYELFAEKDEETYQACVARMAELNEKLTGVFGGPVFVQDDGSIRKIGLTQTTHLIYQPFEGVLHPGKMMESLLGLVRRKGVRVLNGVNVIRFEDKENYIEVHDKDNRVWRSKRVIVATNAYAGQLFPELDVRPVRNQVYLTEPIQDLAIQGCFHYDRGYIYFRQVDGRILIGGARNMDPEVESTDQYGTTEFIRQTLSEFVSNHILGGRQVRFEQAWSGILGTGAEKSPIVQEIGTRVLTAVRLGGMGVAIGTLVGIQAAERTLSRL